MDFVMTEPPCGGQDIIWEGIGFWERCLGNTAHQKTREGDGVLGVYCYPRYECSCIAAAGLCNTGEMDSLPCIPKIQVCGRRFAERTLVCFQPSFLHLYFLFLCLDCGGDEDGTKDR